VAGAVILAASMSAGLRAAGAAEGVPGAGAGATSDNKVVTLASLVESLRSAKFQEREEATLTLMRLPVERRSDIEAALARETDMEAAIRLTKVAVHMMLKSRTSLEGPVSLLGITLSVESWQDKKGKEEELRSAVVVTGVQPGFPAAEVLQPGDRIVAVDGKFFDAGFTFEDFRGLVARKRAGTVLQATVMRSGKQMKAGVRLAGLSEQEMLSVNDFVSQRLRESALYVKSLKSGVTVQAAVVRDDSPPEFDLRYNGVEFEAEP
jgi:hypothetical protein